MRPSEPVSVTVATRVAAFTGRCSHGYVLAVATIRTEHLDDVRDWLAEGLDVRVEVGANFEHCIECLGIEATA